ncbi:MAG: hypothetical protein IKX43_08075 [Paludibacteraceae bacterium]|jgi:hypothetical protein|nr:hypothetical protein [Paludibacteraceae bacterium]
MVSYSKFLKPIQGLFASLSHSIATESKYLTIETSSGKKISFSIADNPMISIGRGSLTVESSSDRSYRVEDVKGYHFSENKPSLPEFLSDAIRVISSKSREIQLMGVPPSCEIAICSENGSIRDSIHSDQQGNAWICDRFSAGTYLITVGNKSFHLIKK